MYEAGRRASRRLTRPLLYRRRRIGHRAPRRSKRCCCSGRRTAVSEMHVRQTFRVQSVPANRFQAVPATAFLVDILQNLPDAPPRPPRRGASGHPRSVRVSRGIPRSLGVAARKGQRVVPQGCECSPSSRHHAPSSWRPLLARQRASRAAPPLESAFPCSRLTVLCPQALSVIGNPSHGAVAVSPLRPVGSVLGLPSRRLVACSTSPDT